MAAVTGQLRVRTTQRELRVAPVDEMRCLPRRRLVAGFALCAHAPGMHVDGGVASRTLARQLVFKSSGAVAGLAGCGLVRAIQRETGLLLVVEARVLP